MKILIVPDVPNWAIGQLTNKIVKHNQHLDIDVFYVHPRDARDPEIVAKFKEHAASADIIHFQYWRSASQLYQQMPEFLDCKKTILTHHNQKNLLTEDWSWVGKLVAHTDYACKVLSEKYGKNKVLQIRHGIDLGEFQYKDIETKGPKTIGYVGRIVPWKGLKEVARAAYELGYPVLFMGKQDKISYWAEIPREHQENIDFSYADCKDDERAEAYRAMTIYVGNSRDGIEEGTLGYFEAMACGVPVVTTLAGTAADFCEDGKNALVVDFEDYDGLKHQIKKLMEDAELRNTIRQEGWNTVKNFPEERMAWDYAGLYFDMWRQGNPLVSVIIPTTNSREKETAQILESLSKSTYPYIQPIVVIDEESVSENESIESKHSLPVRFFKTGRKGYNLAMARNLGIIHAHGEYIMFCDSRLDPDKDAISVFLRKARKDKKVWLYGEKGGNKKTFVENFSFIRREHLISAGMFNERIDKYGGMSQELRERYRSQGFEFRYVESAKATQMVRSKKGGTKRADIVAMKFLMHQLNL